MNDENQDPGAGLNRRILLIDDTSSIHLDFQKILAGATAGSELEAVESSLFDRHSVADPAGFELDSAYQGQEGLAKVCAALEVRQPYAMAFVDLRMPPGWDGIETIQHLWRKDPWLQIVICTAYSDYSWDEVMNRLGAGDRLLVLKKPFDNIEVCQLANALTVKWEMARRAESKINRLQSLVEELTHKIELSNRARGEFLVEMSREIRAPLQGILGMTELLLHTELSSKRREYLGWIGASAEALTQLIVDHSKIHVHQPGKSLHPSEDSGT